MSEHFLGGEKIDAADEMIGASDVFQPLGKVGLAWKYRNRQECSKKLDCLGQDFHGVM